jgi:SAM-dependent methyltransferase
VSIEEKIYQQRWDPPELQGAKVVWKVLVERFFQPLIGSDKVILDVGCGFCHFLNFMKAKEKWGVDANPGAANHASEGVRLVISNDLALPELPDSHFDCIFLSNFLEHLNSSSDVISLLERARELLKPGGSVVILQPNFRLVGSAYFDFIDHKTVLTDRSVDEALNIAGLKLTKQITRFLPYTTKSRVPQHPVLVRLYLACPPLWLFMGKQSLFVAEKRNFTVAPESTLAG